MIEIVLKLINVLKNQIRWTYKIQLSFKSDKNGHDWPRDSKRSHVVVKCMYVCECIYMYIYVSVYIARKWLRLNELESNFIRLGQKVKPTTYMYIAWAILTNTWWPRLAFF